MSKKKNSKSVIITIIITLIVLGCLTFAGVKFLLPQYTNGQETSQYKIYEFAVKVFPLLVGVVLIVIASMIATNREDEEDEEDKLPPNSYDKQLFEAPADDPTAAAKPVETEEAKQDEVAPEEAQEFYSIFDAPADEKKEETAEAEAEAEEPAEDTKKEVAKAAAAAAADPSQKPLLDAIYSLVNKLDEVTDYMSYEEEDDDEDDNLDDYEYYDYPEGSDEYEEEQYRRHHYDNPLENKIDRLCDAIANLTTIVSSQAGAPVAAPVAVAAPVEAAAPAPAEEQAAPAAQAPAETVIQTVEVPVDKEINDIDATDPIQRARIEFDSAKDGEHDISFVYTNADVDSVLVSLGGTGDAFEINGRTVAIIPFLTGAEAQEEMDKLGVEYEIQTIDANAIMDADFDAEVAPRLA